MFHHMKAFEVEIRDPIAQIRCIKARASMWKFVSQENSHVIARNASHKHVPAKLTRYLQVGNLPFAENC